MSKPRAAARRGGADEVITVDAHELRALIQRIKAVDDRKLRASMRKALKAAADLAVDGVRETVTDGVPSKTGKVTYTRKRYVSKKGKVRFRKVVKDVGTRDGGRSRSTGLRADIAKATKASLLAGSDKGGGSVKIVAADSRLAARHKGMAKGYNASTFRHPVFADAVNGDRDSRTRGFRALDASRRASGRGPLKSWTWAYQRGQGNYFGRGVYGKRRDMLARLQEAMDDVARQITG